MTGKYIEFTSAYSGQVIKGKNKFCISTGLLSHYRLEKMKAKRKEGDFMLNGERWTFKTIYANPDKREYVPNPTGKGHHQNIKKISPTYSKRVENMELIYSSVSHRLIRSRACI